MMARKPVAPILLPVLLWLTAGFVSAQTVNLLKNPNADERAQHWRAFGQATVDEASGSFEVRQGGYFIQDVTLPPGAAGHYAVLIGRAASERINPDGAITGLPSLSGYMMNSGDQSGGRIYAYLQGQHMLARAKVENEWEYLSGIFEVPEGTERIRLFLRQAERRGVPHNNLAARFDDLGVYVFPTEEEARAFVESTTMSVAPPKSMSLNQSPVTKLRCELAQAPELYGLRLGMSAENVLSLFPGSGQQAVVQRAAVERSRAPEPSRPTWLIIEPHKYSPELRYKDVKQLALRILDGEVFSIQVDFTGPQWKDADEFISSYTAELNLPAPEAWERINGLMSKYIICNNFEVRFYVTPPGSGNLNYISIVDILKEKRLSKRKAGAKD